MIIFGTENINPRAYMRSATLAGDLTLSSSDMPRQSLDPNGANRNITLSTNVNKGKVFIIENSASFGTNFYLDVKQSASLQIILPQSVAVFIFDGTNWKIEALSNLNVSLTELGYLRGVTSAIQTQFGNKVDKVPAAVENNFVSFNNAGNIKDSGSKASDFATASNLSSHTGDGTIHFTQGNISITASQVSDFATAVGSHADVSANTSARHTRSHSITSGSDHTVSGLTAGHVLRATGADSFAFGAIADGDLPTGIDAAKIGTGGVSNTEFGYLDGVTSGIQGQLDGKVGTERSISTTSPLSGGGNLSADRTLSLTGLNGFGGVNRLIGSNNSTDGLEYKVLSGTSNQVTVTHGTGTITLALPQNINTGATPTFAGLVLTAFEGILKAETGSVSGSATTDHLPEGATRLYYTDERVDDRVAALIQNGRGITWTYNDGGNTLTGDLNNLREWSGSTANDSETEIFLGGVASTRLTLTADSIVGFDIMVVGRDNTNNDCAMYKFTGAIKRDGANNTVLVGSSPIKEEIAENDLAWDVNITADDVNEALVIKVIGDAANTVSWKAMGIINVA